MNVFRTKAAKVSAGAELGVGVAAVSGASTMSSGGNAGSAVSVNSLLGGYREKDNSLPADLLDVLPA